MRTEDATTTSRKIYETVAATAPNPPAMKTWDGDRWGPDDAAATIVLQHPGALRALLVPPSDLTAGEAYVYDDIDVEGDVLALLDWAFELFDRVGKLTMLRILRLVRRLPVAHRRPNRPRVRGPLHSIRRDRQAISYHYDVGNDFYRLFLDEEMVYSSGYFLDPSESLDKAQQRKLDVICRKLDLQPGQRLLDVGCGWGALVLHAAKHYGVEATGITLSARQAAYARERIAAEGLAHKVEILEKDYREVRGTFDAIASVGMFEHVGEKQMRRYFDQLRKLLAPGGALLNHGIGTRFDRDVRRRKPTFVSTYVFPDGELLPVEDVIGIAERSGFELRDLESLRTSYALTLRRWVANLERNREAARDLAGERIYRIWRVFMAGSALSFERARISVYQLLLADPQRRWTYGRRRLLAADD